MSARPAPRAILIDAEGTLIQLAEPAAQVYARLARRHGIQADASKVEALLGARLAKRPLPQLFGVRASAGELGVAALYTAIVLLLLECSLAMWFGSERTGPTPRTRTHKTI